ncbi:MAG: amino acid ABC transporter permease, partial [Acidimicrobiales bacterium]
MDVVFDNLDVFAGGVRTTVALTAVSYLLAFAGGLVVAACRVSPVLPLRMAGTVWVEVVRNTPLTVLMVLFFFGFPKIGIQYSSFLSAVIVLSAYTSAFVGETVRAGINAVARGQAEAARAIGLTFPQTLASIVLPQAVRTVVGPLGTLFIALTKNTAIASVISAQELTKRANDLYTVTSDSAVFLGAAVAYMA